MLRVDELDEDIEPYVLNSTPAVPSVGRRCMDYGYEFRWPSGEPPYFISPQGKKVKLEVKDYVPYLKTLCQAQRNDCDFCDTPSWNHSGKQS